MSQQKDVKFDTIYIGDYGDYNVNEDNIPINIEIIPESTSSGVVRSMFIMNDTNKVVNNVDVQEGELCILMKNISNEYIDFEINDKGELIVHGNKANNYSIDDDGNLIYTER